MSGSINSNPLVALSDAMAGAVEKVGASTFLVNARRRMPASGIAFRDDLVLTAEHVVERDEDISVILPDGTRLAAAIAGRDPGTDLALLRLEKPAGLAAQPAAQEARVGQLVLALGRPSSEGIQASLGVVSAIGGAVRTWRGGLLERYVRTDAIPYPGFSGGPLVSASGDVLGMNTSGLARGASLTIPVALAWQVAASLAEHGSIKRGYLGVRSQLVEIPVSARQPLGRGQSTGLLLVGIETDSPAEEAGLIVGDILVAVAGQAVEDHDELLSKLTGDVVGRPISLQVLRAGQPILINVTVRERTPESGPRRGRWHR